jgi:hypothetical protein
MMMAIAEGLFPANSCIFIGSSVTGMVMHGRPAVAIMVPGKMMLKQKIQWYEDNKQEGVP